MSLLVRNVSKPKVIYNYTGLRSLATSLNIKCHTNYHNGHHHQQYRYASGNTTDPSKTKNNTLAYALFGMGALTMVYFVYDNMDKLKSYGNNLMLKKSKSNEESNVSSLEKESYKLWHSTERKDLPTFKLDEIQQHNSMEKGVWVTYGIGVYDITKFIPKHPGSDKIMLGAGSAIDPFWAIYQQHNTQEILTILEKYRIGNISPEDEVTTDDMGSPWAHEPKRHPLLKATSERPFNAEPPITILADNFYTPNEFFYVRNHLPVPVLDEKAYELDVEIETAKAGATEKQRALSYEDIKALPKYTVTAAVMCGGNRRSEMTTVKSVKGKIRNQRQLTFCCRLDTNLS